MGSQTRLSNESQAMAWFLAFVEGQASLVRGRKLMVQFESSGAALFKSGCNFGTTSVVSDRCRSIVSTVINAV